MDSFAERKAHTLQRMACNDKSKKGSVDAHIIPLLDAINALPGYYTTSSCSGRIVVLHEPESKKKNAYTWVRVTHDAAETPNIIAGVHALAGKPGRGWFRMQTAIVHVACEHLDAARALLGAFHSHGWKRSGAFAWEHDVMVELLSVEAMDIPVMQDGTLLVQDAYIANCVRIANEKLLTVHEKLAAATARVRALGAKG